MQGGGFSMQGGGFSMQPMAYIVEDRLALASNC